MLITLPPFGDLSRFVRPSHKVQLHESALVIVDGLTIQCSGTILAARSTALEERLAREYEICLEGFQDNMEQFYQGLELLYGGTVDLTETNVTTFLKLGIKLDIIDLVDICGVWLVDLGLYQDELHVENSPEKRLEIIDRVIAPRLRQISRGSSGFGGSASSPAVPAKPPPQLDALDNFNDSGSWEGNFKPPQPSIPPMYTRDTGGGLWNKDTFIASPGPNVTIEFNPPLSSENSEHSEDFPPLSASTPATGWIKVTKTSKKPEPDKRAEISTNPVTPYKPSLNKWRNFSIVDMERLCSAQCVYPGFVKVEVAMAWITEGPHSLATSWQDQIDHLLGNIDPLQLSDRYISMVNDHLESRFRVRLPSQFDNHIINSFEDEVTGSNSKFSAIQWTLNHHNDYPALSSQGHVSFYGSCAVCERKEKQEFVFKTAKEMPCYDLRTDQHRTLTARYTNHYHPNTVFHWFGRLGKHKNCTFLSMITHSLEEVMEAYSGEPNCKIVCLQLNKQFVKF